MKFLYTSIIVLFIGCSSTSDQKNSQRQYINEVQVNMLDQIATKTFDQEQYMGLAIAVSYNGNMIYSKGFGYANKEQNVEVDPSSTRFRVGSISKPFTAALLGQLYEEELIDLDVPIQEYVSGFPQKKWPISVRQLAGHLAGIRHYRGTEFMSNTYYKTVTDALSIFQDDELLHQPGTKYQYSSYAWNLISAALEGTTKTDFLTLMSSKIFVPLGMNHTVPDYPQKKDPNRVQFYNKSQHGGHDIAPTVDNSCKWAGGGFLSSAEDVVTFAEAHLNGKILKPGTFKTWTTSQATSEGKPTNYGIGWRLGMDKKNRSWIGHSGGSIGGSSMMLVYPEHEIVVVTLINQSRANASELALKLANQILPSE